MISIAILALSGCSTLQTIISAPTPDNINEYIAQLEVAQINLNNSVTSLVNAGYIQKGSNTAKTISAVLAGSNAAIHEAEVDYASGDTNAALLAYNTAKSTYEAVETQIKAIKE